MKRFEDPMNPGKCGKKMGWQVLNEKRATWVKGPQEYLHVGVKCGRGKERRRKKGVEKGGAKKVASINFGCN